MPPPGLVYLINAWPPLHSFACRLHRRRYTELTVGYAESHDQALVGDQVRGGVWSPCPHSYATQDQAWLVPRVCRASRGILGSERFRLQGQGGEKGQAMGQGWELAPRQSPCRQAKYCCGSEILLLWSEMGSGIFDLGARDSSSSKVLNQFISTPPTARLYSPSVLLVQ